MNIFPRSKMAYKNAMCVQVIYASSSLEKHFINFISVSAFKILFNSNEVSIFSYSHWFPLS